MATYTGTGLGGRFGDLDPNIPRTFPLTQNNPFIWLAAIDIPSDPRTKMRIAAYPDVVQFERNSSGTVISYLPFSWGLSTISADTEGTLPTVTLEVQNVTQEMESLFRLYNGLVGERVRLILVRKTELPDGAPIIDDLFVVESSGSSAGSVKLGLSKKVLQRTGFPNRRIQRGYCASVYGGPACGYDTTRAGALLTCDKSYDGTNGCTVHGDDEEAAGLENRHPNRFLGFRGIVRKTGIGITAS